MKADRGDWKPSTHVVLVYFTVGLTVFRLWAASRTGLIPDEAYYWLWSQHPQAGYYDHPPMIAWWIWLPTHILDTSPLTIRLLPVLSAAADTLLIYAVARELALGREAALLAALFLNAMFMFGLNAAVATPDAPSVMFWLLALWVVAKLRHRGQIIFWLLLGLFAGLGCVSKYTNLFLGLGIPLFFAADRDFRRQCSFAKIGTGLSVALIVFAPVILWNARHDWVSFIKQFGRIGAGSGGPWNLLEFLLTQFVLLNPLIAILAVLGVIGGLRRPMFSSNNAATFLVTTSLPLAGYMLAHSLQDRVQGNWLLPIYPAAAILAALATDHASRSVSRTARSAILSGIWLLSIVSLYMATPLAGTLPVPSPADGAVGWGEIAKQVRQLALDEQATWVGTADYGVTGELRFHLQDTITVSEVVDRVRYSFELEASAIGNQVGVLILRGRDAKPAQLAGCFKSIQPLGTLRRLAGKRELERYLVLRVEGAIPNLIAAGCPVAAKHLPYRETAKAGSIHFKKTL